MNSPMRIVAIEAVVEIPVLVVATTVASMVMWLLLLAESWQMPMVHVARNGATAWDDVRTAQHLLCVHCNCVILIHFLFNFSAYSHTQHWLSEKRIKTFQYWDSSEWLTKVSTWSFSNFSDELFKVFSGNKTFSFFIKNPKTTKGWSS